MKNKNYQNETAIQCGRVVDSLEKLKVLCKEEAEKLLATIDVPANDTISIPFWTSDFPELICVGHFKRDKSGSIVYELDFSESTL